MKKARCPNCPSHEFDVQNIPLDGIKVTFVKCKDCGTVVGTLLTDLPTAIKKIMERLDIHSLQN